MCDRSFGTGGGVTTRWPMTRLRILVAGGFLVMFVAGGFAGWVLGQRSPARAPSDTDPGRSGEAGAEPVVQTPVPPPDPMYRGRPLDHWRALIKTGGFGFSGWGGYFKFFDDSAEVILSFVDGSARELFPLMEAFSWDADPFIRKWAAQGLVFSSAGHAEGIALDGLRRLLRDPERCVRRDAAAALELTEWTGLPAEDRDRLTNPVLRPRRGEPEYGLVDDGCPESGRVSAAELGHLADRPEPMQLRLGPDVADRDLAQIGRLGHLLRLDLAGTQVTDAGLDHLASLPQLRQLNVSGTAVTPDAVARLRESLPNLRVTR
jgi:hypothetical protein